VLPAHGKDGNLPPGIHPVTWAELEQAFATTPHRRSLVSGLYRVAVNLRNAGCSTLYVDGSFVTTKTDPGDFDGCWEPLGVKATRLDPVLLDFRNKRLAQKLKYGGELFPSSSRADRSQTYLEFFQHDKNTGDLKGILALDLRRLP